MTATYVNHRGLREHRGMFLINIVSVVSVFSVVNVRVKHPL